MSVVFPLCLLAASRRVLLLNPLQCRVRACSRVHRELRQVIKTMGETMEDDEIDEMMQEADTNGNGLIDYKEFVAALFEGPPLPQHVHIPDDLKPFMKPSKIEQKKEQQQALQA